MSGIQMYLEPEDVETLLAILNNDDEIAFFKSTGPGNWIAINQTKKLHVCNVLWHTKYKDLPLYKHGEESNEIITAPWSGWVDRDSCDMVQPYFGPVCTGIINLDILVNRYIKGENNEPHDIILISGFSWIGNYFRSIGNPALKETEDWWKRLRKKVSKISKKITIEGNCSVYAFPYALKAIESGKMVINNPSANDTYMK